MTIVTDWAGIFIGFSITVKGKSSFIAMNWLALARFLFLTMNAN
ncbi:MAG: hypothetical protein ACOYIR_05915 [Christensenellales bacterium]